MTSPDPDTDGLLDRTAAGDQAARGQLLQRHRARLCRMVEVRMDPRLAARMDPSDVVQEIIAAADRRLDDYARERPLPFYPWLRQIAADRLADAHRRHVQAARRSVGREEGALADLPEGSALALAERLVAPAAGPSEAARREELRVRVRAALGALSEKDREVLVLRHLEQLPAREVAAVLGMTEAAVKSRALRAAQRLRELLGDEQPGGR